MKCGVPAGSYGRVGVELQHVVREEGETGGAGAVLDARQVGER